MRRQRKTLTIGACIVVGSICLVLLLWRISIADTIGVKNALLLEVPVPIAGSGMGETQFTCALVKGRYAVSVVAVGKDMQNAGTVCPKAEVSYKWDVDESRTLENGKFRSIGFGDAVDLSLIASGVQPQEELLPYPLTHLSHFRGRVVFMKELAGLTVPTGYQTTTFFVRIRNNEPSKDLNSWKWYCRVERYVMPL